MIRLLACKLLGHRWKFDRVAKAERGEFPPHSNLVWWWEWHTCERCGTLGRELCNAPQGRDAAHS